MIGLLLSVCLSAQGEAVAPPREALCVMSYNIHHAEGTDEQLDVARIVGVLQAEAPDIVCLQEVDRNLPRTEKLDIAALLGEALGMAVVFEANFAFSGGEYGNAILSRFPVLSHTNHRLPGPEGAEPRGCLVAELETPLGRVRVGNTHWGLNPEERKAQGAAMLELLADAPATVIAGDFNENLGGAGLGALVGRWRDAWEEAARPKTYPAGAPKRRIDYILVSSDWNVLSSRVVENATTRVASDHLPYVVRLERLKEDDAAAKRD